MPKKQLINTSNICKALKIIAPRQKGTGFSLRVLGLQKSHSKIKQLIKPVKWGPKNIKSFSQVKAGKTTNKSQTMRSKYNTKTKNTRDLMPSILASS
jgi:hypothetical protein